MTTQADIDAAAEAITAVGNAMSELEKLRQECERLKAIIARHDDLPARMADHAAELIRERDRLKMERDEAREAARTMYKYKAMVTGAVQDRFMDDQYASMGAVGSKKTAIELWPWLKETT